MRLNAIDLFAGCGGLSLGLAMSGWKICYANEIDQWAADSYRKNHPDVDLRHSDIRTISSTYLKKHFRHQVDLVAGGPPCQGYSVSGKRQFGLVKAHNTLVEEFIRVVDAVRPTLVLLENVSGFRTGMLRPGFPVMDYLSDAFDQMGYQFKAMNLQAADYGVPSLRNRWFVVASRAGFPCEPFPRPTHGERGGTLRSYATVEDAISDLPVLHSGEGSDGCVRYTKRAETAFQREMRVGSRGVANHVAMKHTPRLVQRFSQLTPGARGFDIGRVGSNHAKVVTNYKSNNQRLIGNRPSLCITANFQSNYVHPHQPRNLTAREAARLMTFPDRFVFLGKRTQMSSAFLRKHGREHEDHLSQYNQIGNSVPPKLGKAIGESLAALIEVSTRGRKLAASSI